MLKRSIIAFWITIILGFYPSFALAADIYVKTPVTRTTINTAIASASPGDVVIIPDGTYNNLSNKGGSPITVAVSGTSGNEISLKPATVGGVKFTGTARIEVTGSYWIIQDFKFEDLRSYSPLTLIITPIGIHGDNVRITNCYFKNIGAVGDKWGGAIMWYNTDADNGEVDYNTFEGWAEIATISTGGAFDLHIHHNYFTHPIVAERENVLHLGYDALSVVKSDTNMLVEYNYFYKCRGARQMVDNKTSSNTYRYNVSEESEMFSLRKGDDCVIDSNYFLNSAGYAIRSLGEGHIIKNNYIAGTADEDDTAFLWISSGTVLVQDSSGSVRSKNIQVLNNTITGFGRYGFLIGKRWPSEVYDPENLTFKNNIITKSVGYLVGHYGCKGTFIWENNRHYNHETATYWIYGENGGPEPDSGIVHAATVIQPVQPPISVSDVGVSWMREKTTVQAPEQLRTAIPD